MDSSLAPNFVQSGNADSQNDVTVTACVCTRNRSHYVERCLDSLRQQNVGLDGFNIVLVDSASSPEAAASLRRLVASMPNAVLGRLEAKGISLARNMAAQWATGDYVAFIDDDAIA